MNKFLKQTTTLKGFGVTTLSCEIRKQANFVAPLLCGIFVLTLSRNFQELARLGHQISSLLRSENTPERLAHKRAALQRKRELANADEIDFSQVLKA